MDYAIHNIKTFASLNSAPHTAHKTMRAPCVRHGQGSLQSGKPPPRLHLALCGLLNTFLMAVDFTDSRKTGRRFLFSHDAFLLTWLTGWQCYVAKYP